MQYVLWSTKIFVHYQCVPLLISPCYSWKIAELLLNNNHPLAPLLTISIYLTYIYSHWFIFLIILLTCWTSDSFWIHKATPSIYWITLHLAITCHLQNVRKLVSCWVITWWWKKPEYSERTTDHGKATGKLYHLRLRVECTLFVIYKAGREHTPYWW